MIVCPIAKNQYQILDGHHRTEVLKELGYQKAWCEVWDIDSKKANLFLATVNRLRGTDDANKRSKLIAEIYKGFGEEKDILLRLLPETEKSLNILLKTADAEIEHDMLSLEDEQALVEGQLSQIVDPEEAEKMSRSFKQISDGKMRLTFLFDSGSDYALAKKFFGGYNKQPDTNKLVQLIGGANANPRSNRHITK